MVEQLTRDPAGEPSQTAIEQPNHRIKRRVPNGKAGLWIPHSTLSQARQAALRAVLGGHHALHGDPAPTGYSAIDQRMATAACVSK